MAQGKFSNPRPHRDEERQIEQAFRQVTQQQSAPRRRKPPVSEEEQLEQAIRKFSSDEGATRQLDINEINIPELNDIPEVPHQEPTPQQIREQEDAQIEQAFQQVTGQPIPKTASASQKKKIEHLRQDLGTFFDGDIPLEEEEATETEPDFVDKMQAALQKAMDFCTKNQKVVLIALCCAAVALIGLFLGIFISGFSDPYDGKILSNVYIAEVNVGGMTQEEAISAVKLVAGDTYTSQDMVIDLSGVELRLTPKDTDAKLDVKSAVEEAYSYGRTGTQEERDEAYENSRTEPYVIDILPHLGLDTDYIHDTLTTYAEDSGSTLTQATYGLEGDEPELAADKFDEKASTQTLVITLGTPGIGFDAEDVYEQVLFAYRKNTFLVTVEDVESVKDPDPIDLEAIYDEFYIEPVDASVDTRTYKTIPGSYGYEFDLKEAQKLIDKAEFGETVRIPMQYIEPNLLDDEAFFRDTLGEAKTRYTSNDSRTTNLKLACQAINGTVLMPGESMTFSSKLSSVSGYKSAAEDTGMTETAQGGVTQVASTLYYAALQSDLDIVSRNNLGYVPSYIDIGFDAATGLKIKNSLTYPVRIEAQVSGGYVKVQIIGTDERDYYIVLGSSVANTYEPETEYEDFEYNNAEGYLDGDVLIEGTAGYLVKTFKVKYSNSNGKQLSSDFIANSQYPVTNRLVARVEPEPTTAPTEAPTQPPETTKPTETVQPTETVKPTETTPPSSETTEAPETSESVSDNTKSTEAPVTPESQEVQPASDGEALDPAA